jgi:O-antigen ligase
MSPNRLVLFAVVLLLFLAPVPLGSNRPFFWALNGIILGAIALAYIASSVARRRSLAIPLSVIAGPALLYALTAVWMVVQVAPVPARFSVDPWAPAASALGIDLGSRISVDPSATIGALVRLLSYVILFFLVVQATVSQDRARILLNAAFWIVVVHAGVAIVSLLQGGDQFLLWNKWASQGYATGFFVNRNSFATFVGMGMAIGIVLFMDAATGEARVLNKKASFDSVLRAVIYAVGLLVLATALLLTASRMGTVAAAAGGILAFSISARHSRLSRTAVFGLLFLAVAGTAALLTASGAGLVDRVGSLESDSDDRLALYRQVVELILIRPWVGFGAGAFADAFQLVHRPPLSLDVTWDSAHNLYLELFATLGFAAVGPILACILLFGRNLGASLRSQHRWAAPAAAVSATLVGALHSLVDFSLQIEANAFLLTALLAAGTAQALSSRSP